MSSSKFKIFSQPPPEFFRLCQNSFISAIRLFFRKYIEGSSAVKILQGNGVRSPSILLSKSKLVTLPDQRSCLTLVDASDHAHGRWESVSLRAAHPSRMGVKLRNPGSITPLWCNQHQGLILWGHNYHMYPHHSSKYYFIILKSVSSVVTLLIVVYRFTKWY